MNAVEKTLVIQLVIPLGALAVGFAVGAAVNRFAPGAGQSPMRGVVAGALAGAAVEILAVHHVLKGA